MLIPYQVEAAHPRLPWVNFSLIGVTTLIFIALLSGNLLDDLLKAMILDGWNPTGLVGHMLIHGSLYHLIGNMIFLWVFGNAVCSKIGNAQFALLYLAMGLLAATTHNLFDGSPAVGASGAINGVVGMFLAICPVIRIHCFYFFFFRVWGTFRITAFWIILFWFATDIYGAASNSAGIAYWGHIGGFLAGLGIGLLMLRFNCIELPDYAMPTLYDYMTGRHKEKPDSRSNRPTHPVSDSISQTSAFASTPQSPDETGAWRYVEWYDSVNGTLLGRTAINGLSLPQLRVLTGAGKDDLLHEHWPLSTDKIPLIQRHACGAIPIGTFDYYFAAYGEEAPV